MTNNRRVVALVCLTSGVAYLVRSDIAVAQGAAAGLLNLMGNPGGVLSIWLVPRMSAAWRWNGTLGFWAAVAFVAALLWLSVQVEDDKPLAKPRAA